MLNMFCLLKERKFKQMAAFILCVAIIFMNFSGKVYAKESGVNVDIFDVSYSKGWFASNTDIVFDSIIKKQNNTEVDYASIGENLDNEDIYMNNDELLQLFCVSKNIKYFDMVLDTQNDDGGFGLTKEFISDPYDTILFILSSEVFGKNSSVDAFNSNDILDGYSSDKLMKAVNCLLKFQNNDGGFGYTAKDDSRVMVSAMGGLALLSSEEINIESLEKLDALCVSAFTGEFDKESFNEQTFVTAYMYCRDLFNESGINEKEVLERMYGKVTADGSVYSDISCTKALIIADYFIRKAADTIAIKEMESALDSYVLTVGSDNIISGDVTLRYRLRNEDNFNLKVTVVKDNEEITCVNNELVLERTGKNEGEKTIPVSFEVKDVSIGNYLLRLELISTDETKSLASHEIELTIHDKHIDDLVLSANCVSGNNYGITLSWNDISSEEDRFGYRVFRSKEGGEFETRSTWDGEEKVRVLNIYPSGAKGVMKKWLEEPLEGEDTPAGLNLFEIDEVAISDYNVKPDYYLMDDSGDYKYDVLMFGSSDSNSSQDLSESGYESTRRFVDSGRGVLFGHDTVCNKIKHNNFAEFSKDLGIVVKYVGSWNNYTNVEVVDKGFLTSYPWELKGKLVVPTTHAQGQFTGGSNTAKVWMRFPGYYNTDTESGGVDDAYLFTKNSVAMIQTGHSNGQATDDERKVFANTLFYLKQLTFDTRTGDKSFLDETKPGNICVSEAGENKLNITAEDFGTNYEYYVEGVGTSLDGNIVSSNHVSEVALSGLQGFVVSVNGIKEAGKLLTYDEVGDLTSDVIKADGRGIEYELDSENVTAVEEIHLREDVFAEYSEELLLESIEASDEFGNHSVDEILLDEGINSTKKSTENTEKERDISKESVSELLTDETNDSKHNDNNSDVDSENPEEDILLLEDSENTNIENSDSEKTDAVIEGLYLHVCAVDNAGNTSDEVVLPFQLSWIKEEEKEEEELEDISGVYFDLPYSIVATDGKIDIACSKSYITGDMYCDDFRFEGSKLCAEGTLTSTGEVTTACSKSYIMNRNDKAEKVEFKDYLENLKRDVEYEEHDEIKVWNTSSRVLKPTICNSAYCSYVKKAYVNADLVCDSGISFNANRVYMGEDEKVILCSKNGDIDINTTKFTGNGFIYAPNGTVTIQVSECNFHGTIIAKNVVFRLTKLYVNQ